MSQTVRSIEDMRAQPKQSARRTIRDLLETDRVKKGIAAVAGKLISPERVIKLATTALIKTPKLAECTPDTFLGSLMASASLGLEPNTPAQQAYLIPYKTRRKIDGQWEDVYECQFQIGYRGFITLGYRSTYIKSLKAECVHLNDTFDYSDGSEQFLKFKKSLSNRGAPIGAFCFTRLPDDEMAATVLPLEEILKIRSKSDTWRTLRQAIEFAQSDKDRIKAEQKFADTPWEFWFDDMSAKSAVKKHVKQLPIFGNGMEQVQLAAAIDDASEDGVLDMAAFSDPDAAREVIDAGVIPTTSEKVEEEGPAKITHNPGQTLRDVGLEEREKVQAAKRAASGSPDDRGPSLAGMES